MSDVVTQDYQRKKRAGIVINNPMGKISLETRVPTIDCTTTNTGSPVTLTRRYMGDGASFIMGPLVPAKGTADFGYYPDPPETSLDVCMNVIATQAWKNVNAPSALSLVTLAEAHKTFNLIHGTAVKLARIIHLWNSKAPWSSVQAYLGKDIRLAKRPKFMPVWTPSGTVRTKHGKVQGIWVHEPLDKRRWELLDEGLRRWLEWRYGWNPLLKDIVDHMKAITLAEPWRERPRHTARGYFSRENSMILPSGLYNKVGGNWTHETAITKRIDGKSYVIWELEPGNPFGRLNDFGLFDVPRTVLELIPYSFVAAWFVDFDAFLRAWQPKIGATVVASGAVIRQEKRVTRTIKSYERDSTVLGSWPTAPVPIGTVDGFTAKSHSRTVPLSRPSRPIVSVEINTKRLVDAIALLKGAVSRNTTRI